MVFEDSLPPSHLSPKGSFLRRLTHTAAKGPGRRGPVMLQIGGRPRAPWFPAEPAREGSWRKRRAALAAVSWRCAPQELAQFLIAPLDSGPVSSSASRTRTQRPRGWRVPRQPLPIRAGTGTGTRTGHRDTPPMFQPRPQALAGCTVLWGAGWCPQG
uniref:Uncharacterized protein n=1 Tax=Molossus molossus TaxID=27622 RepID=A0A7J8BIJ6_MOLMO|nr:hypothetical protein HJG59_010233 [Molossus molossus]